MFDVEKRQPIQVNLVPLINVVFLLLLFFLLAGTMKMPDAPEVSLPVVQKGQAVMPSALILTLDNHSLRYGTQQLNNEQLKHLLQTTLSGEQKPNVLVQADAITDGKRLTVLLQLLTALGAEDVTLLTR